MTTEILGILAAAIASFIIGIIWYHPKVFGTIWTRLPNLSPENVSGKRRAVGYLALGFLANILVVFVLSMQLFAEKDLVLALARTFWLWLGFIVPVLLASVIWEGRSWKLYCINAGYWFVATLVMAIVLTLL